MKEEIEDLSKSFLKTNLYTEFGSFLVSTIYRRGSDMYQTWYYETFAWKLKEDGERENYIFADNSGARHEEQALEQHSEVCKQLIKTGEFTNP